jgi:hypothetical protein
MESVKIIYIKWLQVITVCNQSKPVKGHSFVIKIR